MREVDAGQSRRRRRGQDGLPRAVLLRGEAHGMAGQGHHLAAHAGEASAGQLVDHGLEHAFGRAREHAAAELLARHPRLQRTRGVEPGQLRARGLRQPLQGGGGDEPDGIAPEGHDVVAAAEGEQE